MAANPWWITSATPPLRATMEMEPGSGFVKVKLQ